MEWLKKLLEAAAIKEGKLDVEALITSINTEFPKNAVPKETYNDTSKQLKTANDTIKGLKEGNVNNEALQKTIKEHEDTIATLKTEAVRKEKEINVRTAFEKAGAMDPDYLIFKNGGVDKFELDKDGNIKDLDNLIKASKENNPTFFKAVEGDDKNKDTDPKVIVNKLPGGDPPKGDDVASIFANALTGNFN